LLATFDELKSKLPVDAKRGSGNVDLDDPDTLLEVLDDVEELFESSIYDVEGR
jgi:hypothetical protein